MGITRFNLSLESVRSLQEVFHKICNTIDTPVPNTQSIYRLRNHNNERSENSKYEAIIVKLWSKYDRNFFFNCIANYQKLHNGFVFGRRNIGLTA